MAAAAAELAVCCSVQLQSCNALAPSARVGGRKPGGQEGAQRVRSAEPGRATWKRLAAPAAPPGRAPPEDGPAAEAPEGGAEQGRAPAPPRGGRQRRQRRRGRRRRRGGGGGDGGEGEGEDAKKNTAEALAALAALGKSLESLPADLAKAVTEGKVTGAIVERFFALQGSPLFRALLGVQGFKDRLLADDLFLTKVGIECGVGLFTKVSSREDRGGSGPCLSLDLCLVPAWCLLGACLTCIWFDATGQCPLG